MTKQRIVVLLGCLLLAGVTFGVLDRPAEATCYEQFVRVACPSGQIAPSLVPSDPYKVNTATTVNGHSLGSSISLSAADVNADAAGAAAAVASTLSGYQTTAGMSAYATTAGMSAYATTTTLTNYQTTAGMSSYETTAAHAATTVQADGNIGISQGTATATATSSNLGQSPTFKLVSVPESVLAFSDTTVANASTSAHGLLKKLPNDASQYIDGSGNWSVPPGTGGGSSFTTAYSVDFAGLAAQNLKASGDSTYTIDGKSWTTLNTANATTLYLNDGTHAGLYVRCSATYTIESGTSRNSPMIMVPIGTLSNTLATNSNWREAWAWVLFSQPHTPNANYEFGWAGVVMSPFSFSSPYQRVHIQRGWSTSLLIQGSALNNSTTAYTNAYSTSYDVFVLRMTGVDHVELLVGTSSGGGFPARSTLTPIGMFAVNSVLTASAASWTILLGAFSGNTAGASDILFKKLLLEYR
jgi:hypothetical protein